MPGLPWASTSRCKTDSMPYSPQPIQRDEREYCWWQGWKGRPWLRGWALWPLFLPLQWLRLRTGNNKKLSCWQRDCATRQISWYLVNCCVPKPTPRDDDDVIVFPVVVWTSSAAVVRAPVTAEELSSDIFPYNVHYNKIMSSTRSVDCILLFTHILNEYCGD